MDNLIMKFKNTFAHLPSRLGFKAAFLFLKPVFI